MVRIKSIREEIESFLSSSKGVTVNKLCKLAGILPSSVYPLLKGKRNFLRADNYKKLKAVMETLSKASDV